MDIYVRKWKIEYTITFGLVCLRPTMINIHKHTLLGLWSSITNILGPYIFKNQLWHISPFKFQPNVFLYLISNNKTAGLCENCNLDKILGFQMALFCTPCNFKPIILCPKFPSSNYYAIERPLKSKSPIFETPNFTISISAPTRIPSIKAQCSSNLSSSVESEEEHPSSVVVFVKGSTCYQTHSFEVLNWHFVYNGLYSIWLWNLVS